MVPGVERGEVWVLSSPLQMSLAARARIPCGVGGCRAQWGPLCAPCALLCCLPGSALPPPCKLLPSQARAAVVILSPLLGCSRAVLSQPLSLAPASPRFLPCSAPCCSQLGGAQSLRRAEELGCSGMLSTGMFPEVPLREAPMGPPPWSGRSPGRCPAQAPSSSSGKLSVLPASPFPFRLFPRLRSPVAFFPPLIHK